MIHLGDITKINGAEIEPVDCITAGSPCQDLSVAGKRAGLEGERSGLFMEQIRIIKEMREHDRNNGRTDEFIRPRYMVWENVPGAFSSNKGEDFRCVLEETAKVAERDAVIPGPPKGKWSKSGAIMGDGWSIAWRVHDAQFWGVPQRRKRIALVADFGGSSAPEILFERKCLSGDIAESGEERQRTAKDAKGCVGALSTLNNQSVFCLQGNGIDRAETAGCNGKGWCEDVSYTLNTIDRPAVMACGISSYDSNSMKSPNPHSGIYEADTARTLDLNGGSPACNQGGIAVVQSVGCGEIAPTMKDDHQNRVTDYTALCVGNGQTNQSVVYGFDWQEERNIGSDGWCMRECAKTITSTKPGAVCGEKQGVEREVVTYANDAYDKWSESEKGASLRASGGVYGGGSESLSVNSVVRRLTPLECERLQGYPDNWTNIGDWIDSKGKKHKGDADSPRYKALGNSIALPFWFYLLRRISAQYERPATLGSLFDGIGGFPLCWERCNGKGTARWASEIEEFPIAVTKHWFG